MIILESCYVFEKKFEIEELKLKFQSKITENKKFDSEIDLDHISITEGYIVYPFIEGSLKNLQYLVLRNGKQQSGVIDVSCSLVSKEFLLLEHSTKQFSKVDDTIDEFHIFNVKDIERYEKEFIERILDKTASGICKRHNLILTDRANSLDISPIQNFDEFDKRYYLEMVYCIDYFSKKHKKPFKSYFSSLYDDFYTIDFKKSELYNSFYKLYKSPIVSLPKIYLNDYYDLSFQVYQQTMEELKYIKPATLLNKIKKNVKYEEYTKHEDYLNQLIFYFRKREYLKLWKNKDTSIRYQVFYCYLTLKHNPQSGYILAEFVKDHIIEDNYLRLLTISEKQGNTLAKKALFEYYSEPKNYNSYNIKRYT